MLNRIIRSPFMALLLLALTIGILWLYFIAPPALEAYYPWFKSITLILIGLFFVLVLIHNRLHPTNKLSIFSWTPYEFKEEDEGMRWITLQACRKVYMFFYIAIPVSAILIAIFHTYSFMPLLMLLVLGAGQYWIYWWEIRKYSQQEKG